MSGNRTNVAVRGIPVPTGRFVSDADYTRRELESLRRDASRLRDALAEERRHVARLRAARAVGITVLRKRLVKL